MPRRSSRAKGADWILANDVSPAAGVMGGDDNTVQLVSADGVEDWPTLPKARGRAHGSSRAIADALPARREAAE